MNKLSKCVRWVASVAQRTKSLLLPVAVLITGLAAFAQQNSFHGKEAGEKLKGATFLKQDKTHLLPTFIRFDDSYKISQGEFFSHLSQSLGFNEEVSFKLLKEDKDEKGMTHFRYVQTYNGIPVEPSYYILHVKDGRVVSANGNTTVVKNITPSITLSEADALAAALKFVDAKEYMWQSDYFEKTLKEKTGNPEATYFPKGELIYRMDKQAGLVQAYKFHIVSLNPHYEQRVFVNAATGEVFKTLRMESNCSSASVNTIFNGNRTIFTDEYNADEWRLRDDCQAAEVWIRDWNSATTTQNPIEIDNGTNTWTTMDERFGGTVLWETMECYDYFLGVHTRSSYDGGNGDVEGYINAVFTCASCTSGVTTNNASMSFTGGFMKVGLGSSGTLANSYGGLDVIAHEYTHAVTGSSSMLEYEDESGALNESFSDIFGETIERYTTGSNDWLMAGDRTGGAIRDMSNPKSFGDPDTYLGTNWVNIVPPCDGNNDECGVHTNSGVQNFWYYLVVIGGSGTNDNGDDYDVTGIGMTKARKIAFTNLVSYLGENSTYADARDGSIQAAIDLYGACSDEVETVTNAWYAVGVGDPFITISGTPSDYNGYGVSCFGDCDGSVSVSVDGDSPFDYDWSSGETTASISGKCAGSYTLTVTDDSGCERTASYTITSPEPLMITGFNLSDYNGYGVTCYGASDGIAQVQKSGGVTPYSYNWSNGETSVAIDDLPAGDYSLTLSDANGCEAVDFFSITEPPVLTLFAEPTSDYNGYNISCHGGNDGVAEATAGGGVPGYSYEWSDGQTTAIATNLYAGDYSVTVTDLNNCMESYGPITLTEPDQLVLDAGDNKTVYYGYPDSSCADPTSGGASGGVPPYSYLWSNNSTALSIHVCPQTTTVYYLTVTDLNGCVFTDSVKICVIDVRCGNQQPVNGDKEFNDGYHKVVICHMPPDNLENGQTDCVGIKSVANHLAHGDLLGECGIDRSCEFAPAPRYGMFNQTVADHTNFFEVYPNPFDYTATIKFSATKDINARIDVYDLSGKVIATPFNSGLKKNIIYDVEINGTNLMNGIYFCKLSYTDGTYRIQKIIYNK